MGNHSRTYYLFDHEHLSGTVSVTTMTCWHSLRLFNIHPRLWDSGPGLGAIDTPMIYVIRCPANEKRMRIEEWGEVKYIFNTHSVFLYFIFPTLQYLLFYLGFSAGEHTEWWRFDVIKVERMRVTGMGLMGLSWRSAAAEEASTHVIIRIMITALCASGGFIPVTKLIARRSFFWISNTV